MDFADVLLRFGVMDYLYTDKRGEPFAHRKVFHQPAFTALSHNNNPISISTGR